MFKTIFKPLIASSAIVSALVLFNTGMDATGGHHSAVFEAAPTVVTAASTRYKPRRRVIRKTRTTAPRRKAKRLRTNTVTTQQKRYIKKQRVLTAVPTQNAAKPLDPDERADFMLGVCNSSGGGASTNPDGTVSCVDPDGNDVLDPVPSPD